MEHVLHEVRKIGVTLGNMSKQGGRTLFVRTLTTVAAFGSVFVAYQRFQPCPTVYARAEVNTEYSKDEFKYPKYEIRFGNVGLGPMWIRSLEVVENKTVVSPEKGFPKNTKLAKRTSISPLFGSELARSWYAGGIVPIVTYHPIAAVNESPDWSIEVTNTLHGKNLALKVEYSWSRWLFWPSSYLQIPICPRKAE